MGSYSADDIQRANNARSTLRRKLEKDLGKRRRSKWPPIQDERAVKRPVNPYAQFVMNRNASGDFKNIQLGEVAKLISQEWKALSDQEKSVRSSFPNQTLYFLTDIKTQKYKSLGTQEAQRYAAEYRDVYGHEAPQAAAAAA